jgi:tetratricopeptide (TPR) repeat protein
MIQRAMILTATAVVSLAGCAKDANKPPGRSQPNEIDAIAADDFGTQKEPPIAPATFLTAGQFAEGQNELDKALEQYNKAIAADANLPRAWYLLASLQARMGSYDASIASWQRYMKLVGTDASAYANLGFTYDLADRFTDAEAAYRQAIQIDAKHKASRVNYGLMLARAGRMDDAVAQFAAVLPPAEVRYNVASFYEQQGKLDLARAEYGTALEINPSFTAAKTRLAALSTTRPATRPAK